MLPFRIEASPIKDYTLIGLCFVTEDGAWQGNVELSWLEGWFDKAIHGEPGIVAFADTEDGTICRLTLAPGTCPPVALFVLPQQVPAIFERIHFWIDTFRNLPGGYTAPVRPGCIPESRMALSYGVNLPEDCPPSWCNIFRCPGMVDAKELSIITHADKFLPEEAKRLFGHA
jgi:hypothetical protein